MKSRTGSGEARDIHGMSHPFKCGIGEIGCLPMMNLPISTGACPFIRQPVQEGGAFMYPVQKAAASVLVIASLAACGGGETGQPTDAATQVILHGNAVTLSAANYESVGVEGLASSRIFSQRVVAAALEGTSEVLGSSSRSSRFADPRADLVETCELSGSIQSHLNDLNGNGKPDPGDSVVNTYSACSGGRGTVTGVLKVTFHAVDGGSTATYPHNIDVTVSMQAVTRTYTSGSPSISLSGVGRLKSVMTGNTGTVGQVTFETSGNDSEGMKVAVGSIGVRSVTGLKINQVLSVGQVETTVEGLLTSPVMANGSITLSTPTPLRQVRVDGVLETYPSAGQFEIVGAAGAKVQAPVANGTQVDLRLLPAGASTPTNSVTKAWVDITG